ncbi:hypothetical protein D3C76_1763720 [compost metagenome]
MSAPSFSGCCKAGVLKQLSTTSCAPLAWAISARAAISTSSAKGFEGDSTNSSLVLALIAASQAARSVSGT